MSITDDLYDSAKGLFKSALRAPQAVDLTAPHAEYKLILVEEPQQIHSGQGLNGPLSVPVWGYKGQGVSFASPGPVLLTEHNHAVSVTWKNELPAASNRASIFPFDFQTGTLTPVLVEKYPNLKADIITHVHGAAIPSGSDGWPTECYGPSQRRTHHYHNQQPATTIWYHDHAMDQTGLNVYAGIAGGYVILDQTDRALSAYLTSLGGNGAGWAESFGHGPAGIPLVIQDRLLADDGSRYVYATNYAETTLANNVKVGSGGEFFGRINLVNGQVSPNLAIGPTALRLKLLNGCNSRFLVLCFVDESDQLQAVPIYHLGDDHGRRHHAHPLAVDAAPIRIGPGERLDLVADFSAFANRKLRLVDIGAAPFGGDIAEMAAGSPGALDPHAVKDRLAFKRGHQFEVDDQGNATTTVNNYPEIMQFDVANVAPAKPVSVDTLNRILLTGHAVKTRVIALREFVMYCEMMQHGQHQHAHHYVERCAPDQFANVNACEAAAMLVLEELEPAGAGDTAIIHSQFDLFDPHNRSGSFDYKVVGNTAGSLDPHYQGGKLRYVGDMQQAWLDHPYVVKAGSAEVWRFVNLTGDTHPMHIHLCGFEVVDSTAIACTDPGISYIDDLHITPVPAPAVAPNLPDYLQGSKDTVQVDPGTVLTVVCKFEGGTGRYVYHCHMLEHEDHMMMRKFKVV